MAGNFPTIRTTGDRGLDELLRRMDSRLAVLERAPAAPTVPGAAAVPAPAFGATIEVRNVAGSFSAQEQGIEFDDTNGFDLSQSGANAKVHIANLTIPGWGSFAGGVGIGVNASPPLFDLSIRQSGITTIGLNSASNTAANGGQVVFVRSRGTIASPSDPQSGNAIGQIDWKGELGVVNYPACQILGALDTAPGASHVPGVLTFSTTSSTTDLVERMRIDSAGHVGIGVTSPTAVLHLAAGTATANTAPLKFTNGTNLTAAEAGAMEWDGVHLYQTQTSGPTRKSIAYRADAVALTDAATIVVDATLGDVFTVTLGGNRTLGNPTGAQDGQRLTFRLKQDGTGSRTLAYDTKFRFGTDIAGATLTTTASKTDYLTVIYNSADDKFDAISFVRGY